jgi:hypothetical protein
MNPDPEIERLAVLIVVNCFRNTVLEHHHAECPEFGDDKMKALMTEAVDRTYTALCGLLNPTTPADYAAMRDSLARNTPQWDRPKFDQNMIKNMESAKTLNGIHPTTGHPIRMPSWDETAPGVSMPNRQEKPPQ